MNKENKILQSDCGFDGDIAGFIYGELDSSAAERVTLHLASCKGCSEEVEGLTGALLAFRDWRSSEFESLSTPAIELPGSRQRSAGSGADLAAWLRFLLRPQVVVAASFFVLAALVAGIYVNSSRHLVDTASVPVVESESLDPKPAYTPDIASSPASQTGRDAATTPQSSEREPRVMAQRATRSSASRSAATIRHSRSVTVPVGNQYARKAVTVPEVVEKREPEDETLRLADLFSEVDAG